MPRLKSLLVAAAILIGSVAVATFLVSLAPEPERQEPPSPVPFVQTAPVAVGFGAIPVFGAGTVRPSAEIAIAPQVGGRVVWVAPGFLSGGRVAAGQTLFRIEESDYVNRVREAEAELAARQVAFLEAQEEAEIARAEYGRYSGRQASDTPPEANALALHGPQLNAARTALVRAQAWVDDANLALSRTQVNAPFDGFVREESVDVGQLMTAGQAVGRLYAADAVEVVVPLSDAGAAVIPGLWALRAGDTERGVAARVFAEYGDGSYAWEGYADRAESSLDEQSRTIDVIVRVPDPFSSGVPTGSTIALDGSPPLLVGKFVEVESQGLEPERFFGVRRAALQPGNEIWTVRDDETVSIVPVRVLQRGDDEIFVTGALGDGWPAITGGIQFATNGMLVRTGSAPGQ